MGKKLEKYELELEEYKLEVEEKLLWLPGDRIRVPQLDESYEAMEKALAEYVKRLLRKSGMLPEGTEVYVVRMTPTFCSRLYRYRGYYCEECTFEAYFSIENPSRSLDSGDYGYVEMIGACEVYYTREDKKPSHAVIKPSRFTMPMELGKALKE